MGASPKPSNPGDLSTTELFKDLHAVFRMHALGQGPRKVVLVGHSFGTSLVVSLIASLTPEERQSVKAAILMGASLAGHGNAQDGGHPLFRLPVFFLNWVQPFLTR